jgi:hypothetical protein
VSMVYTSIDSIEGSTKLIFEHLPSNVTVSLQHVAFGFNSRVYNSKFFFLAEY